MKKKSIDLILLDPNYKPPYRPSKTVILQVVQLLLFITALTIYLTKNL